MTWSPVGWRIPRHEPRHEHWMRLFRGQESELRQLRDWLTGLLPDSSARDDLISVAVELGTNAVQHTASGDGGWFTVEVASLGPVLRVAVTDEGATGAPPLADDPFTDAVTAGPPGHPADDLDGYCDDDSDCGRGLIIVRALSVASGVCGNGSGRTVWAEVAATPPASTLYASPCPGAQGRSSNPASSSAMASSRTL
ncbi:MAG: ATP-binding protein [Actinobacteria bacterium]|nr:ATP-binding protein [Actinomycetota bacterium]